MFDVIIVHHNDANFNQHLVVLDRLKQYADAPYELFIADNSVNNVGFSRACNIESAKGYNPFIALLNPDVWIEGPFFEIILSVFSDPRIKVTGANNNKNPVEIHGWGLNDWVCGAQFFVRRDWWDELHGFDEQFVWAYEETDFCRRTEALGGIVKSLTPEELPILHSSPPDHMETEVDLAYKQYWMGEGGRRYAAKWA